MVEAGAAFERKQGEKERAGEGSGSIAINQKAIEKTKKRRKRSNACHEKEIGTQETKTKKLEGKKKGP